MSADAILAKLEARVLAMGGLARWLRTVDELKQLLAMGDPDIDKLVLALSMPDIEAQVVAATLDAFGAGIEDAQRIIRDASIEGSTRRLRPSPATRDLTRGIDKDGRSAMAIAHKLARAGADTDSILAPIFGHANRVRGTITDAIHRAGNEGSTALADAARLPTVWVAEVNACVTCLAYSGRVAKPGEAFPAGKTYGKRSTVIEPIPVPPAHPRCRCTIEPLVAPEYAQALRREADRSVLRGFSLESESMATRVDAASRLLDRGVVAPKSVLAYAQNAVKRGEFTTRGRPE